MSFLKYDFIFNANYIISLALHLLSKIWWDFYTFIANWCIRKSVWSLQKCCAYMIIEICKRLLWAFSPVSIEMVQSQQKGTINTVLPLMIPARVENTFFNITSRQKNIFSHMRPQTPLILEKNGLPTVTVTNIDSLHHWKREGSR